MAKTSCPRYREKSLISAPDLCYRPPPVDLGIDRSSVTGAGDSKEDRHDGGQITPFPIGGYKKWHFSIMLVLWAVRLKWILGLDDSPVIPRVPKLGLYGKQQTWQDMIKAWNLPTLLPSLLCFPSRCLGPFLPPQYESAAAFMVQGRLSSSPSPQS